MALGGILGGLAGLGTIAQGAQEQQYRRALAEKAAFDTAQQRRKQMLQQQQSQGMLGVLQNPRAASLFNQGALTGVGQPMGGPPMDGGASNFAPGSVTGGPMGAAGPAPTQPPFLSSPAGFRSGIRAPSAVQPVAEAMRTLPMSDTPPQAGPIPPPGFGASAPSPVTQPGTAAAGTAAPATGALGLTPQQRQQGQAAARTTIGQIPQPMWGRLDPFQVAKFIDEANPDLDPEAKVGAVIGLVNLMSAGGKQQFAEMMQMLNYQQRGAIAETRAGETAQRDADTAAYRSARLAQGTGGQQVVQTDQGAFVVDPRNAQARPVQGLPAGPITKLGAKTGQGPLSDAAAERYAKIYDASGYLPPGISRSSAAIAQIMNKTGDTGTPGDFVANMATKQADQKSLANMTKLADAATSYENTAIRNFDQALQYAGKAIPTEWGPWLNRWVMEGQKAIGDPTAPAYVVALLTAANEYAKVMSGSTGAAAATEGARHEAAEFFSPYLAQGQVKEVITVAKQEMENRRQELYAGVDDIKNRLRVAGSTGPTQTGHAPGQQPGATPASGQGRPSGSATYGSADDVLRAIESGALTPDAGKQIMIKQFGYTE